MPPARGFWLVLIAAGALLSGICAAWWWSIGESRPVVRVVGPSMAEAFHGRHGQSRCQRCGEITRFDLEGAPLPVRVTCWNCGTQQSVAGDVQVIPGDEVQIAPAAQRYPRYAVVAFRIPGSEEQLGIKRVLGLPGEHVAIEGGEVLIDGQPIPQDDDTPWLGPLVHRAHATTDGRWQFEPDTGWSVEGETFVYRPQQRLDALIHWVTYHHQVSHDTPARTAGVIVDNDAYNPSLSRALNEVCDLRLQLSVKFERDFMLQIHDGWRAWTLSFDLQAKSVGVWAKGNGLADYRFDSPAKEPIALDVSIRDGYVRLMMNERRIVHRDIEPGVAPRAATSTPVAFGALRGNVTVFGPIVLSRDVYYLDPVGLPQPWEPAQPLGPDEYFLLGDNVPVSTDSRHFGPVKREAILGEVRKVD